MRIFPSLRALLFALVMLLAPAAAFAQIGITVAFGPPELPIYDQPICPGDGYIWTPGYWAYADDDYYWVPGTWVLAPEVGFFWTPPYWAWGGSGFVFYDGYWGPVVGFYGGIDYGFGYFGHGFEGGRWDHDHFFYNRAVANVDINIVHNVYETRVEDTRSSRVSFNGGNGGINDRPRPEEEAAARERHVPPVAAQSQHVQAARSNPQLRSSTNHGRPPVAATPRPGAFSDRGVVTAREGGRTNNPANQPARAESGASRSNNEPARNESGASRTNNAPARTDSGASRSNNPGHVKDLPPIERPAPPNTGNAKADQRYQQQQQKLSTKQDQERQRLQQKQEQDHQRLDQQKANDAARQQTEQRHQQQTQQLVQKHTQQQQQLQQKQQPSRPSQSKQKP